VSDTMLLGCLRMPIELYPEGMSKESASFIVQQQSRCVEAADKIEQLQKENEAALKLLTVHTCPDCNGDGAYCDNYGEPVQCQYCYEVEQLISNKEE
jgi:hypothetical protein